MALQTIVSRENSPLDPAVVTVGSIHGGTRYNIIPDEVNLQLTVRTYKEEVRRRVLASIERIIKGVAATAGIPEDRAPIMKVAESSNATYNEPKLIERLVGAFKQAFGEENVVQVAPIMASEDFGNFSLDQKIPATIFWLGASDPAKVRQSRETGVALPGLHSALFSPVPEPTLRTGVKAMTSAVLELMRK
jgi:hippurate hydrolase